MYKMIMKKVRGQIVLAVSSIFAFAELRNSSNLITIGAWPTFSNVVLVFGLNPCQKVKSRPEQKHGDPVW